MKILFIGNSASRTGAPLGLLLLLQWLKKQTNIEFELLLRVGGGELFAEYERLCPVAVYGELWSNRTFLSRVARRCGLDSLFGKSCLSPVEALYKSGDFDLIYSNTITNGGIIAELSRLEIPILCHVHELETMIAKYGSENLEHHRRHCVHFIADSRATQRNLVKRHGFSSSMIELAYEFVDVDDVIASAEAAPEVPVMTDGCFIVGGCGYSYHRKGKDLFVALAKSVLALDAGRSYRFVWVGGEPDSEETKKFLADIERGGLSSVIQFIPHVNNVSPYFKMFDVFALTSREEPLGMVMLEAASLACPVLCFEASGGALEFVGQDAGFVIPGLSVDQMAERTVDLANQEEARVSLGKRAADKVRARHDVNVVPAQIHAIIEKTIKAAQAEA